jgi:hypothetical protein
MIGQKLYTWIMEQNQKGLVVPDNAKEIAVEFINKINTLIRKHNIQKRNICNFDQVPWYFEMESSHTLARKGSRDVKQKSTLHHIKGLLIPQL